MKKIFFIFITIIVLSALLACSDSNLTNQDIGGAQSTNEDNRLIVLKNDFTNEKRNILLAEDIEYFGTQLSKKHKNPFSNISKQEFDDKVNCLKSQVDELTNVEVFSEMNKIIASIGDAHTWINYFDGYRYPLKFYSFYDGIYVINADKSLKDIVYSKLTSINGIDIDKIKEQLKVLIAHENDKWVDAQIPSYLEAPVFMFGLGIIPNEEKTTFSFEKSDGEVVEKEISCLSFGEHPDYCISYGEQRSVNLYDRSNEKYYWYEYLKEKKTLYFKYNVCSNMEDLPFKKFNFDMFKDIKGYDLDKVVIDFRHNSGGDSSVINPFLESLSDYVSNNPKTEVFIIIGRDTFSSGVMGVLDIQGIVPAVLVGEATGGSPNSYGEILNFELLNTKLPVYYSTKYFKLTDNDEITIAPDMEVLPSINDFKENSDAVMKYILR